MAFEQPSPEQLNVMILCSTAISSFYVWFGWQATFQVFSNSKLFLFHLVDYDSLLELNAKAAEEMRAKEDEEDEQLVQ